MSQAETRVLADITFTEAPSNPLATALSIMKFFQQEEDVSNAREIVRQTGTPAFLLALDSMKKGMPGDAAAYLALEPTLPLQFGMYIVGDAMTTMINGYETFRVEEATELGTQLSPYDTNYIEQGKMIVERLQAGANNPNKPYANS